MAFKLGSLRERKESRKRRAFAGRYVECSSIGIAKTVTKTEIDPQPRCNQLSAWRFCKQRRPDDYSPVGDVWSDETKHLLGGLGDSNKDTVVDLQQSEELQDLSGLGSDLGDTVEGLDRSGTTDDGLDLPLDSDNKVDLGLGRDVVVTGLSGLSPQSDLLLFTVQVLLDILVGSLEDDLSGGLSGLTGKGVSNRSTTFVAPPRPRARASFSPERWLTFDNIVRGCDAYETSRQRRLPESLCIMEARANHFPPPRQNRHTREKTHLLGLSGLGKLLFPGLLVDPPLLQQSLGNGDRFGVGGSHLFGGVEVTLKRRRRGGQRRFRVRR